MPALLHKTRFPICAKAERKNAASVSQVIIDQLKMNICVHLPPNRRNEFSYHIGVNETLKGTILLSTDASSMATWFKRKY